ncbi:MAG: HIT domain-containing protein [Candidatus Micrarchaeia archaeon]
MEKTAYKDIFDSEQIIGASTILKIGSMRIVASLDADHEYHFLLMPIAHRESFTELTGEELKDMQFAERAISEFYKAHGIDGYSKIELVGKGAGRTIEHLHWHFVPGKSDVFHNNPKDRPIHRNGEQMKKVVDSLRPEFEEIMRKLK